MERAVEILIPLTSWGMITFPFWLSFWHPALVAYFIITFDVYWFYRAFVFAYNALRSYITMTAHQNVDWLTKAQEHPDFHMLHHVIIIPEYKEPVHILRRTLETLTHQDMPAKQIIIVFATESKDDEALQTATELSKEFAHKFGKFIVTSHPLVPGEVAGKSSNMAWAGREVEKRLEGWNIDIEYTTVTSCDADALLHPKYLSYLSYLYLNDTERTYHFYQGAIFFYSNFWRIPLPNKIFSTIGSIYNLALLSQTDRFINFSTYSLPLATAKKAGYWGVDVIPEDYHLFFKVYFALGEKVQARGIFLPISVDAAESHGWWRTFKNQYEQTKRWAWGVSDMPYIIRGVALHKEIPRIDRLKRLIHILEQHLLWPTNWFILTIGSNIPPLVNPAFGRTVLGHNLSNLSSGILTLSALFLLVVFFIDWKVKPPRPKDFALWKMPFMYAQWVTLPVLSFFLSALPGLDAHTRMMLGKRLEYKVTEKV